MNIRPNTPPDEWPILRGYEEEIIGELEYEDKKIDCRGIKNYCIFGL